MNLPITFACGAYDRTLPLLSGEVKPEGIDLTYKIEDNPRDLFDSLSGGSPYEAAELSVSEYICRFAARQTPFVAIPVFPSRVFRHSFIFINKKAGIRAPKDLEGKRIGTPLYTATAMVYMRALLQHDYGIDLATLRWIEGDLHTPGRHTEPDTMPLLRPAAIEANTADRGLFKLLEDGGLDAMFSPSVPPGLGRHPDVTRLFPDYRGVEMDYFRRTGIFPIMHLVAIRKDIQEKHRFVARNLYKAFCQAKDLAMAKMLRKGAGVSMLPWARAEAESMQALFGRDFWPYGLEPNRPTLEALTRYLTEQAMIDQPPKIEDLFADIS